ncbi:MAG: hypothetical protein HRT74_02010 [Flavobacteriales bacterium]|nr:hypothetical protein [Flavobacteriales bacterium]
MNEKALLEYKNLLQEVEKEVKVAQGKLSQILIYRLLVFGVLVLGIVLAVKFSTWIIGLSILSLILFLRLVKINKKWSENKQFLLTKQRVLQDEIRVLQGQWPKVPYFKPEIPANHPFALDLDVLGERSIYALLSRSYLNDAKHLLVDRLLTTHPTPDEIPNHQRAVKELQALTSLRVDLRACGEMLKEDTQALEMLKSLEFNEQTSSDLKYMRMVTWLAPISTIIWTLLFMMDMAPATIYLLGLMGPLVFLGPKLQSINNLSQKVSSIHDTLESYMRYFHRVGNLDFDHPVLRKIQSDIKEGEASIRKLTSVTDQFDQRNNVFVAIILNGLIAFDFRNVLALHKWFKTSSDSMKRSIQSWSELEYWSSLSTWSYNHEHVVTWPEVSNQAVHSEGLKHPFMLHQKVVENNVDVPQYPHDQIITGANMAGKSTYLRTVGSNYVLASLGMPVPAKSFKSSFAPLFTSMRTTDSLQDGKSYFLSELERLSLMIDNVKEGSPIFILLDEILKGTNSNDKAAGSKAFVEQLMKHKVAGMVATHDLTLCTLSDQFTDVENLHFSADIKDNDLSFDYLLKPGVCDTMNATFLMKKLGIIQK